MRACTIGKRHRWIFAKNVITHYQHGGTVRISERGAYHCECGAFKHGNPIYPYQQEPQP